MFSYYRMCSQGDCQMHVRYVFSWRAPLICMYIYIYVCVCVYVYICMYVYIIYFISLSLTHTHTLSISHTHTLSLSLSVTVYPQQAGTNAVAGPLATSRKVPCAQRDRRFADTSAGAGERDFKLCLCALCRTPCGGGGLRCIRQSTSPARGRRKTWGRAWSCCRRWRGQ